jgi:formate-dependent nitrite reductase membrane component NrfD
MEPNINIQKNETPLGVRLISIYYYLIALFIFLIGIAGVLSFLKIPISVLKELPNLLGLGSLLLGPIALIIGIIFIGLGITSFFIAKDLNKGKRWARKAVIVYSVLGILGSLMPINIVGLIISGVVGGYMIFSKKAKEFFY